MKTLDKDKHYLLTHIKPFPSRINKGNRAWRLTWLCVEDADYWDMTVDEGYQNFKRCRWQDFIDQEPYGLYTGLKRTDRTTSQDRNVLTADRRPELQCGSSQLEVIAAAKEITDAVKKVSMYTDLFEEL